MSAADATSPTVTTPRMTRGASVGGRRSEPALERHVGAQVEDARPARRAATANARAPISWRPPGGRPTITSDGDRQRGRLVERARRRRTVSLAACSIETSIEPLTTRRRRLAGLGRPRRARRPRSARRRTPRRGPPHREDVEQACRGLKASTRSAACLAEEPRAASRRSPPAGPARARALRARPSRCGDDSLRRLARAHPSP